MRTISLLGIDSVELFPRCAAIRSSDTGKIRSSSSLIFIFLDS